MARKAQQSLDKHRGSGYTCLDRKSHIDYNLLSTLIPALHTVFFDETPYTAAR